MINSATLPICAILIGAFISLVGTWLVRRWSLAHGFVDRPGGHKSHAKPVALGGGAAVTIAIIAPMIVGVIVARIFTDNVPGWMPAYLADHVAGMAAKMPTATAIGISAAVLCIIGWIDDRRPLGPAPKLILHIAVAGVLVIGFDLRILTILHPITSIAISMLWIVTLINSLNFLDNMDGLSSGVAAIAASIFAITATLSGQIFVPTCCWLLVGALIGFLPFNFHPASIYLGDAGSTVIGLLLAVFTILTTFVDPNDNAAPTGIFAPLIVMAVPLYDTASVMFLRWRVGAPLWTGDRRHFSHRLVRRGMPIRKAVLIIWLATLVTALPAILLPTATWYVAWGIVGQTLLVVLLVALLESSPDHDQSAA